MTVQKKVLSLIDKFGDGFSIKFQRGNRYIAEEISAKDLLEIDELLSNKITTPEIIPFNVIMMNSMGITYKMQFNTPLKKIKGDIKELCNYLASHLDTTIFQLKNTLGKIWKMSDKLFYTMQLNGFQVQFDNKFQVVSTDSYLKVQDYCYIYNEDIPQWMNPFEDDQFANQIAQFKNHNMFMMAMCDDQFDREEVIKSFQEYMNKYKIESLSANYATLISLCYLNTLDVNAALIKFLIILYHDNMYIENKGDMCNDFLKAFWNEYAKENHLNPNQMMVNMEVITQITQAVIKLFDELKPEKNGRYFPIFSKTFCIDRPTYPQYTAENKLKLIDAKVLYDALRELNLLKGRQLSENATPFLKYFMDYENFMEVERAPDKLEKQKKLIAEAKRKHKERMDGEPDIEILPQEEWHPHIQFQAPIGEPEEEGLVPLDEEQFEEEQFEEEVQED